MSFGDPNPPVRNTKKIRMTLDKINHTRMKQILAELGDPNAYYKTSTKTESVNYQEQIRHGTLEYL